MRWKMTRQQAFQERCLRVLKALLKGDTTMQDKLNEMGVTRVMVRMLASPSTPRNFEAALELGTALADGGNVRVQRTIYAELAASGSNDALASIAHALNSQCNKLQMHFLEQKQRMAQRCSPPICKRLTALDRFGARKRRF